MSSAPNIELRFEIEPDELPRLTQCTLIKRARVLEKRPSDQVSVYYDTKRLNLKQAGISLRVRKIGRRFVQMIKRESAASTSLLTRDKWERVARAAKPDVGAVPGRALNSALGTSHARALVPIFATHLHRTTFDVKQGQSDIALTVDQGHIETKGASAPVCAIELELRDGKTSDLIDAAKAVAAELPVHIAPVSTADRGYALMDKRPSPTAIAFTLAPDADVQSAFQTIARACARLLLLHRPMMLKGAPEALHQMRVAMRRLRAAMSVFSELLADSESNGIKSDLKRFASELGPARDLDVMHEKLKKSGSPIPATLRKARKAARARATAAVSGDRFRKFTVELVAWIEAGEWIRLESVKDHRDRPVVELAVAQLDTRSRKLLRHSKSLRKLSYARLHRIRIQAKKLRYASEFFGGVFPGKGAAQRRVPFVAHLVKLQDALGEINDLVVHKELSRSLVLDEVKQRRRALKGKRVAATGEKRAAQLLRMTERIMTALGKAKPFWS